jgi:hypothetical protein
MLVETKGITELALVYGSTWIVISTVIAAIMVLAFLANLLVLKKGMPNSHLTYGLLALALLAGIGVSFIGLDKVPYWISVSVFPFVLTLPLFFSGLAFSSELEKKSSSIGTAMYSNLLGSMLGGFLEYNSMYFGFRSLYLVALVVYGLAFASTLMSRSNN